MSCRSASRGGPRLTSNCRARVAARTRDRGGRPPEKIANRSCLAMWSRKMLFGRREEHFLEKGWVSWCMARRMVRL
jgi:hypothetical protein